jgi:hypothetical protein
MLGDETLFKRLSKLANLMTKKNVGFSIQRVFVKKKGKTQIHLIKSMSEGQKKALMGFKKSFKIPYDVVDVMAQIKRPLEEITHHDAKVKRFKEMARTL